MENNQQQSTSIKRREKKQRMPSKRKKTEIAIIGIACRFPGAENYEEFWENLKQGHSSIEEIHQERWDWKAYWGDPQNENKTNCKWGGFIKAVDTFDPSFFCLSPREVEAMDPQQRIMLELSWSCFEDAGVSPSRVSGKKIGVYIGVFNFDYKELQEKEFRAIETYHSTGTASAVISNRISHYFNLKGPSFSIDTACSSSLHAIHLAIQSLNSGECSTALAGGINLILTPTRHISFSKTGMLSSTGSCKTFDENADGYVRSEGAGLILLKPLKSAIEDGDFIYGVLKGSAVNHNGKTHTLTYPNSEAQAEVIREAYESAGIEPESISYIEAHGTGTPKGDPIEFQGLLRAFQYCVPHEGHEFRKNYCGLGSVKPNIGHLESAAGVAGVIKVLLSMKYKQLPGLPNFTQLNHRISIKDSPFYIVDRLIEWKPLIDENNQALPRRAGVSSFGFGGTNAHVLLEEAPNITRTLNKKFPYYLICLSAKTEKALQQKEKDLALWLGKQDRQDNIANISATLILGRENFEIRAVYVVRNVQELKNAIELVIKNGEAEGYIRGSSIKKEKLLQPLFKEFGQTIIRELNEGVEISTQEYYSKLIALAELYVKGYELDYKVILANNNIPRISLPTYPFAREHYWIQKISFSDNNSSIATSISIALLHPLLHQNTSNLTEQRFSSTFTGEEFFLADHVVKGQRVLSGVAYLEMARAAVDLAAGTLEEGQAGIRLKNVVWTQPIAIGDQPVEVHIGLYPGYDGEISYEIYSEPEVADAESVVHSEGRAILSVVSEVPSLDLKALQSECSRSILSSKQCYDAFKAMGIDYGPEHQGIETVYVGSGQVLAKLSLPSSVLDTQDQFVLHPSLMDSALQASIGLMIGTDAMMLSDSKVALKPLLPFALQELVILGECTSTIWALIRYSGGSEAEDKVKKLDIDLCDDQGSICVRMKGLEIHENNDTLIDISLQASSQTDPIHETQEGFEIMTFEEVWQEQALPNRSSVEIKTMVCFLSNLENQQELLQAMEALDKQTKIIFISQSTAYQKYSQRDYSISITDRSTYEEAFESIRRDYGEVDAMLYLWTLEDSRQIQDISSIVYILQAVASVKLKVNRLLLGGQFKNTLERCYLESWIGYERSLGLVLPNTQIAAVYQEAKEQSQDVIKDWLLKLWSELNTEKALSALYQDEKRHVCKIRPTTIQSGNSLLKSGGTYLITGGLGGLGFLFAKHLVRMQSVNLILTGRSPIDAEKKSQIKKLKDLGCQVLYVQADVCNLTHMKECLSRAKELFGEISGVIHAAGIQGNQTLLEKEIQSFQKVLDPKIKGTLVLDELLQEETLDFICYFSSSAAILGDFGSCDYAISNRFLMAYSHFRNQQYIKGLRQGKAIVINWPLWKDGGMGFADDKNTEMYLKSSGQRFLETEEGVALFERLLVQNNNTQHLVLVGQRSRVYRFLGLAQGQSSFLVSKAPSFSGKGRRVEMKGLSLEQCLEWDLKEHISRLLKIPRDKLEREDILADFGFDSISLAEFAVILTNHYQIEISPALFFGYSTIEKLIQYFLHEHREDIQEIYREALEQQDISQKAQIVAVTPKRHRSSKSKFRFRHINQKTLEPIAIIGMSGRFPQARNIEEMWTILSEGQYAVKEIPEDRFDWQQYYGDPSKEPGKTNCKWCGCMPGVSEFDSKFFEISPREAESMDPRQRLLLQESWKALEDAGYGASQVRNSKIGMFVGVEQGDYQLLVKGEGSIISNNNAILAARLAYFLNLSGPVMAIDTACSSGLVAVHQAVSSLHNSECDTAIAAGVNLLFAPETYLGMSKAGMLSPDGKCFAFDHRANGMVPGEAVAVVVLKRLSQAKADGDPIYAIIEGSGVNYDGKTNGITAPSGVAQTNLLKEVYDRYQVNPEEIEYIVTHGTGTKLGDPVEINALYEAFKGYTQKERFCALTSAKTNFGHTFAASGLVSLISLVQAFRYETIPASLHCEKENDFVNWNKSPFYVNKTNKPWSQGKGRIGAVSAFGMSGTNVHMVLKSYFDEEAVTSLEKLPYYLLAFSAKTQEVLQEKIKDMTAILQRENFNSQDLLQISYTLLEGRQHFNHRCAIVIQDREDAVRVLKQVGGKEKLPNLFLGKVPRDFTGQKATEMFTQDLIKQSRYLKEDKRKYQEILYALADFYCQGYEISWVQLFGDTRPHRIHLPTYPFVKELHWISEKKTDFIDGSKAGGVGRMKGLACQGELNSLMTRYAMQPITVEESVFANIFEKPNGISLRSLSDEGILFCKSAGQTQQTISLSTERSSSSQSKIGEVRPMIQTTISFEKLQEELVAGLSEALYMKQSDIDVDKKFIDMGLDSIIGVEWIKAINKQYGSSFKATIIYDYPTICDFARFLERELNTQEDQTVSGSVSSDPSQSSAKVSLKSIGLPSLESEKVSRTSITQPIPFKNHANPSLSSISIEELQEELLTSLAESLYIKRSDINVNKKFIDMGLDSIIGVEWIKAINKQYGSSIKATIVYDYPTICDLARFLEKELNLHERGVKQTQSTAPHSLFEVLQKVHQGTLDIGQAENLLRDYI